MFDPKSFTLDGQVALVTGAGAGIGRGIAEMFAGAGAAVVVSDLHAKTANEVRGMACNVTSQEDIDALVKAAVDAFGDISTLINNVGWGGRQPDPAAVPEEEFLNSYKLNTISAYRMSMACLPYLEQAKNASITNSGSFSSAVPAYDILPYATAKATLNQMMVSLAHMLNKKVRVNSILIGTVITEGYASAGITPEMQERMMHPDNLIGHPGRPQ